MTPKRIGDAIYSRSVAEYEVPDVELVDMMGEAASLRQALTHDGPVMMQFIFTTCPTICPVMSASFAAVQSQLGDDGADTRLVSISIDPEHDTPARLREYTGRYEVTPQWRFLTGSRENIIAVQQAFDAYQDNKMRHEALTYIRSAPSRPWIRIEGLVGAAELLAELQADQALQTVAMSASPASAPSVVTREADAELGRRIYHDGILPSGEPLTATTMGDIEVAGQQMTCANCHRASGFAGGEETVYVPPITAATLYGERKLDRGELFAKLFQDVQPKATTARVRDGRYRPAYTDETLATAVRHGTDPTGRTFSSMMPRYDLSDEDMGHLVAYLKTLFATPTPGIDDSTIHFATIVTEDCDQEQRDAMLDVLKAYIQRKNADTRGKQLRPGFSPLYKSEFEGAFRQWELHVWELTGSPSTWRQQLEKLYRDQPVFAVISGVSDDSWEQIHAFCDTARVPCLFPHTDRPVVNKTSDYTLYFSAGLSLEASVVAAHLREQSVDERLTILQVYRDQPRNRLLAETLRHQLSSHPGITLEEHALAADAEAGHREWQAIVRDKQPSAVALWLNSDDLNTIQWSADEQALSVYLSHGLLQGTAPPTWPMLGDRVRLVYPYALPGEEHPRIFRVRAWMRSRRIALTAPRIQLNTYFALAITDHALTHLVENFSREYLIESIEHETENWLNSGVYPHLSLGPGQRFASKGAYLVTPLEAGFGSPSEWIVP